MQEINWKVHVLGNGPAFEYQALWLTSYVNWVSLV